MSCKRCGKCCRQIQFHMPPGNNDFWRLRDLEHYELEEETLIVIRKTCTQFDPGSNRCRIYETRPATCKAFFCENTT